MALALAMPVESSAESTLISGTKHQSAARVFVGMVVAVADGDTVTVLKGHEQIRVRISGIDAPEKGQAYGARSKQSLVRLVHGKEVRVDYKKQDRYGRLVGSIWTPASKCISSDCPRELDAGLTQITLGMAWHYKEYQQEQPESERELYANAEIDARRNRQGLWADQNPVPPWIVRRERRTK